MIKWGSQTIGSVYYGPIGISKIYNGSNIVYQKAPPVPKEIRFLASNNNWYDYSYDDISSYQGNTGTLNYRRNTYPWDVIEPFQLNPYLSSSVTKVNNISNIYAIDIQDHNISSIGEQAFYYSNISSINIPYVTSIGESAFLWCGRLSINMPNVTSIGEKAFSSSKFKNDHVEIPNVTSIGNTAFNECREITSVYCPNVSSIGDSSFAKCYCLTSINCSSVTSIGINCFYGNSIRSIDIPNISTINGSTFYECKYLNSVNCPNVTLIDGYAFYNCNQLPSLDIQHVSSIGRRAFMNCSNLSSVILSAVTDVTAVDSESFYGCPKPVSVLVSNDYMVSAFEQDSTWGELCSTNQVTFIPVIKDDYLTFTCTNGTTTISLNRYGSAALTVSLLYSKNGNEWSDFVVNETKVDMNEGDVLKIKAGPEGNYNLGMSDRHYHYFYTSGIGHLDVSGNIMTLLNANSPKTIIESQYCFYSLFAHTNIYDISNLRLPAITLHGYCYAKMFYNCSYITSLPDNFLPAKVLTPYCYYQMFYNCRGLTSLPNNLIQNSSISERSCYQMFAECRNLKISENGDTGNVVIKPLPDEQVRLYYGNMFVGTGGQFTGTPIYDNTYRCYT